MAEVTKDTSTPKAITVPSVSTHTEEKAIHTGVIYSNMSLVVSFRDGGREGGTEKKEEGFNLHLPHFI